MQKKQADLQLIRCFHIDAVNLPINRDLILLVYPLQAGTLSLFCAHGSNMPDAAVRHGGTTASVPAKNDLQESYWLQSL